MKAAFGSVFVVAAMLAVPAPMRAASPQATMSADRNADERIEKRLSASTLKKYDVKVSVTNGVATLTGTVATEADRRKATQLATVRGVTRVENQLIVDQSATKGTMGTLKDKTKEGAEKTKDVAEKVGDKTKEGLSKTGEVITEAWITTRVKSKFIGEDLLKN